MAGEEEFTEETYSFKAPFTLRSCMRVCSDKSVRVKNSTHTVVAI